MRFVRLPPTITNFEREYLAKTNAVGVGFFLLHIPVLIAVAAVTNTGSIKAGLLTSIVVAGPVLAHYTFTNPRHTTYVFAVASMCMGGLLVHFGQGPMQIEMHFYFFVLLALLAMFANPTVILIAAATVVVHHLTLFFLLPRSVFNYDASIWAVVTHAVFVLLECTGACFVARTFFDSVIGLERSVAHRTRQLAERTHEQELMLNTIDQGVLMFDHDGVLAREHSRTLESWFGPSAENEKVWEYLGRADPKLGQRLELAWEGVKDDALPLDLIIDQLPKRAHVDSRVFDLQYLRVVDGGGTISSEDSGTSTPNVSPLRVMAIVSDIGEQLKQERVYAENRQITAVIDRLIHDRAGFDDFMTEANDVVETIRNPDVGLEARKRAIHTLKGNAGMFDLMDLVSVCQRTEDRCAGALDNGLEASAELLTAWTSFSGKLRALGGSATRERIEISSHEQAALVRAVREGRSKQDLITMLEDLRLEPTSARLGRLGEHARDLARRLGKDPISVMIEPNDVRLPREEWAPLWAALIHVVRNAVDHGIETPSERAAAKKPPIAHLTLRTAIENSEVVFEIIDDGRGVAWERLWERAKERGVDVHELDALSQTLFMGGGLTTKDEATEYSGRGVGLGSVGEICAQLGGRASLLSAPGELTRVQLRFPLRLLRTRTSGTPAPLVANTHA